MGFWGWFFLIVGGSTVLLTAWFWIEWYLYIERIHREYLHDIAKYRSGAPGGTRPRG